MEVRAIMRVELYRESEPTHNTWRSRCAKLGLAAHGRSPEVADRNLERLVRLYLSPFEREERLTEELSQLGLSSEEEGDDVIRIVVREP